MKSKTPIGDAPEILDGRALEEWHSVTAEMELIGIGSRVESTVLACYCLAVQQVEDARAAIKDHGLIVQTERGWTKNPACSIMNSAMALVRQFATEFGFTPVSRGKVTTKPATAPDSPWAKFMEKQA